MSFLKDIRYSFLKVQIKIYGQILMISSTVSKLITFNFNIDFNLSHDIIGTFYLTG